MTNQEQWEQLHSEPRFRPRYPHEGVVRFIFKFFPRDRARQTVILDHGCGAGRHTVFLAENGYRAHGTDVSKTGLRHAAKELKRRGLEAELRIIEDGEKLAYPDNYFDGIVSFGVLYYLSSERINLAIAELARVLKPGGALLAVVRSTRDHRQQARSDGEGDRDLAMHFFTERELKKRFKNFKKLSVDTMSATYDNQKILDHDFVITAVK